MEDDSVPQPPTSAKQILAVLAMIRRRGHWPLFQELERREPDLTSHVLEELSLIHQTLLKAGALPRMTRRLQRQVQSVMLVILLTSRPTTAQTDSEGDGQTG